MKIVLIIVLLITTLFSIYTFAQEPFIAPAMSSTFVNQWIRFRIIYGEGTGIWEIAQNNSGGWIDQNTGLYKAGPVPNTVDWINYIAPSKTYWTVITVYAEPSIYSINGYTGSLDLDGQGVGISDVVKLLRIVVGLDIDTGLEPDEILFIGDFNATGQIDIGDVVNALRIAIGLTPNT
ncbi:MAG: hypothetical protein ACTSRG_25050 [Candidatus Helarchaeota archaeon]